MQGLARSLDGAKLMFENAYTAIHEVTYEVSKELEKIQAAHAEIEAEREALRRERADLEREQALWQEKLQYDEGPTLISNGTDGEFCSSSKYETPVVAELPIPAQGDGATVCQHCLLSTDEDNLMLCYGRECNAAWHTYCAGLSEIPSGDWFCPSCAVSVSGIEPGKDSVAARLNEVPVVRNRCVHGSARRHCMECRGCPHGLIKFDCAECMACPHGKIKFECKECCGCHHGKLRRDCKECSTCPHGKVKICCRECNACVHEKIRWSCKYCVKGRLRRRRWATPGWALARRPEGGH